MPKVYAKNHTLIAETSPIARVLCLGIYFRQVILDPQSRELIIITRVFGKARRKFISFDWVAAVLYDDTIRTWRSYGRFGSVTDTDFEAIVIRLALKNGDKIHIWRFENETDDFSSSWYPEAAAHSYAFDNGIEPTAKWLCHCLAYYMQVPVSKVLDM